METQDNRNNIVFHGSCLLTNLFGSGELSRQHSLQGSVQLLPLERRKCRPRAWGFVGRFLSLCHLHIYTSSVKEVSGGPK